MGESESECETAALAKRRIEFVRISPAIDLMQYRDYKPFGLPSVRAGEHLTSRRRQRERERERRWSRRASERAGEAARVKNRERNRK